MGNINIPIGPARMSVSFKELAKLGELLRDMMSKKNEPAKEEKTDAEIVNNVSVLEKKLSAELALLKRERAALAAERATIPSKPPVMVQVVAPDPELEGNVEAPAPVVVKTAVVENPFAPYYSSTTDDAQKV